MHDLLKNVTSIFGSQQERRALYDYASFGTPLTIQGDMAEANKIRFSSEYMDEESGLIYYNYRHLNPWDGRWINRDPEKKIMGFISTDLLTMQRLFDSIIWDCLIGTRSDLPQEPSQLQKRKTKSSSRSP